MLNPTDIQTTGTVVRFPTGEGLAVLTARGDAMVALYRFERMLRTLDSADHAFAVEQLAFVLAAARNGR